jgi:outer membrane cobalamin receptor
MGAYWEDAGNTQRYDGHDLFNLRAEYSLTANLSIFGRISNIFNTRYADRADYAFGNERYFPGEDRGVYAGASVTF